MAQRSDRRLSKLEKALDLRAVRPNTRETYPLSSLPASTFRLIRFNRRVTPDVQSRNVAGSGVPMPVATSFSARQSYNTEAKAVAPTMSAAIALTTGRSTNLRNHSA